MIPLPFWLTNVQFVISAFGVFAFFAAAWLNVDSWFVRKEFKTGLRAAGFLFLAAWSALHGIGVESTATTITSAAILFLGVIAITISFILDQPPLQPKDLPRRQINTQQKIAQIVKGPGTPPAAAKPKAKVSPQPQPRTAPTFPRPAKLSQPFSIKTTSRTPLKSPPLAKTLPPRRLAAPGLRTETLVKIPKTARRRRTRLYVILGISTILTLALIAAAYFIYDRTNLLGSPEPTPEIPFIEEITTPTPTPTATPEPKPTVTVTETETGFLNIRDGASTTTEILTQVNPGETFVLLDESEDGDWYLLQIDEELAGWAAASYLEKLEAGTTQSTLEAL